MQWNIPSESSEEVRTFWTGPALSYYEILSLKSLVATGARVLLYTYDRDLAVPEGVERADANDVLSGPIHEFRHANGNTSFARHSDLFRYVALERFGGWYADLDIVCLTGKLPQAKTYVVAMSDSVINNAILKFPAHSAIAHSLVEQARKTLAQADGATSVEARLSIGPILLKRLIHEQAMDHLILPKTKAYEIGIDEIAAFFDPARCEETTDRIAESDFTHLWNEYWNTLRIPKTFGPAKGSFLDLQFRRFGIDVPEHARLQPEAIEAWIREHRLLVDVKSELGVETVEEASLDRLAQSIRTFGWEPRARVDEAGSHVADQALPTHSRSPHPQTLRTFWHGDAIGPYQLLCLKSFVDRGHIVEVFSYNLKLSAPPWLRIRDAEEILPEGDVLRPVSETGGTAIHGNLFRYTLLHSIGGWWIDPDVMLLQAELPDGDLFFAGRDAFGQVPTGALKCPAGHSLPGRAVDDTRALGDSFSAWEHSGAGLLTDLIDQGGLGAASGGESLGSVSWFDVPDLFDPARIDVVERKIAEDRFLRLHDDAWRRAGIPPHLAPPEGSLLDTLFARHDIGLRFPARMDFSHVRRWVAHMYRSVQLAR